MWVKPNRIGVSSPLCIDDVDMIYTINTMTTSHALGLHVHDNNNVYYINHCYLRYRCHPAPDVWSVKKKPCSEDLDHLCNYQYPNCCRGLSSTFSLRSIITISHVINPLPLHISFY